MDNTCCFFGHRKIKDTVRLRARLLSVIEGLLTEEGTDTFLFGSKSEFNSLCHEIVTDLKEKHPHIKRVFVRAEYPFIGEKYREYILKDYEDTYFPEYMINAGKAAYVERNLEMIDKSGICVVYYNPDYELPYRKEGQFELSRRLPKSGTKIAYEYAVRKKAVIINVFLEKYFGKIL